MAPIRRWAFGILVGVLGLLSGCCAWCDRHCNRYNCCPNQCYQQPNNCCPPVAPAPAWNAPRIPNNCCP